MYRPRQFFTSTALALVLLSAPAAAQDAAVDAGGAAVVTAYQSYAGALSALNTSLANGEDAQAQYAAAQEARAALEAACATAGTPELSLCVETYVSADMRVQGDVAPLPQPAAPQEPAAEEEAPAEGAAQEETAPVEGEPAAEEQQPEAETPAEPEPTAEAETEAETEAEAAAGADQDQPVEPVSDGAEVQAAYAAYADARAVLDEARNNGGDVLAAAEQVNVAYDGMIEACSALGMPDLAACLDMYVSADVRLQNDMTPIDLSTLEVAPAEGADEGAEAPDPEEVAPVLDSAKEEETEVTAEGGAEATAESETAEAPAEPAPQSDEEAQADAQPEEVVSGEAEEGEEISDEEGREVAEQTGAPEEAEVVEQNQFRIVFNFNNQLVVRSRDNERMGYQAEDTRYERLGQGRYRETIYRANGSQLITIYNRNGDILQRSVIEPDGTEYFLIYTPRDRYDDVLNWRDPAEELPPLQLTIPVSEYVLDARTADEQRVYEFLGRPPVERINRLYSVDEVKRSARLRDVMRRLEIGDLTFDSGSAALSAEQYGSLAIVAEAMYRLLEENPREMFLIEGHTDAVGSDVSNLALSDARAETVAVVLTQNFGIPPENLATQGYGERYLAVRTEGAERLNRRVTVKRITPLVSPNVAAAG